MKKTSRTRRHDAKSTGAADPGKRRRKATADSGPGPIDPEAQDCEAGEAVYGLVAARESEEGDAPDDWQQAEARVDQMAADPDSSVPTDEIAEPKTPD